MNNLTPLQEVASRIYAAKIAGLNACPDIIEINWRDAIQNSIDEAKALLEATKPEPLEWKNENGSYFSNGGEFRIGLNELQDYVVFSRNIQNQEWSDSPYFGELEEAKAFAEHIRTR